MADFLNLPISQAETNEISYFHEENFLGTMLNLFVAGTDTTAKTIQWGLLLMMKYQKIQKRAHEEIQSVIGSERSLVTEDRKNLPYTNAVLCEIQRIANIIPMGSLHQTSVDTHFRGYFLPKGTQIIPLLTTVLHDKTQWEKPSEFYPPHFLDAEGKFIKMEAFMPFSAGRRTCAGEILAKTELFLFFVILLQTFRFSPPPGVTEDDLDLTPCFGITTSPVPYELCAVPYQTKFQFESLFHFQIIKVSE
nr:PREDICTED: cytochrome P450 2K1-like [Latimeria chalumnae]|eukprot:XP_014341956.1 PREDICTED: cytochrome P450 2K1-like [Latimeria chalumnae]